MADINLKRFVDIDIRQHVQSIVSGTRDTVVLYTADNTDGNQHLVSSLAEANSIYSENETTLAYLTTFFNNGGVKALVIENKQYTDITKDTLKELSNDYICVAYATPKASVSLVYDALKKIAKALEADADVYGINEKLILAHTTTESDIDSVKNFIVKYTTDDSVVGSEMTFAAYLSKINVYGTDTVYDYAYTQEVIKEQNISDSVFAAILDNNMNVDIYLANAVRNCGGNCKDGSDMVNTYCRILLHQTLTESLLNLLTQKIKNSTGISKIYATIAAELEKYRISGYLTTDKAWLDADVVISYNGVKYTVIEQGTPLTNGYVIKVLPMSSLTPEDRAAHKAPHIYVIFATQFGIRSITINGEVI